MDSKIRLDQGQTPLYNSREIATQRAFIDSRDHGRFSAVAAHFYPSEQAPHEKPKSTPLNRLAPLPLTALKDDKLIDYAMGKINVLDSEGHSVNHGRLWRGNQTVNPAHANPPQFTEFNKDLQRSLARIDGYHGAIDGIFGAGTERSVKNIETEYGFAQDGRAGTTFVAVSQVKEAKILLNEYTKDNRLTADEKIQLKQELADIVTMQDSLTKLAKKQVANMVTKLETMHVGNTDPLLGQTLLQLKQIAHTARQ